MNITTPLQTWLEVIKQAQLACHIGLDDQLESYLVFMLMRYTERPQMAESILGLELLEAAYQPHSHEAFRDVGDKCLLFSGLFPQRARSKQVSVEYVVSIGKTAYARLADHDKTDDSLFRHLSDNFICLRDVLHALRQDTPQQLEDDLLMAFQLWEQNKSNYAQKVISSRFDVSNLSRTSSKLVH